MTVEHPASFPHNRNKPYGMLAVRLDRMALIAGTTCLLDRRPLPMLAISQAAATGTAAD
ncbi:hypothetical protein ACE3MZ_21575 [Paenibacillus sp. WLX1005]|uniref:hypothetical protein n=1 Tax=unclassified Paenibacillus TaxID=185978 RepID=UPI003983E1E8